MRTASQRGFSLIELFISLTLMLVCLTGLASMMVQNSKINKAEQIRAQVQANARNSLAMVVQKLRSAGWDPLNAGLSTVTLDPDTSDDVSIIEVFADLDEDGDTDEQDEQVLIFHRSGKIYWRRSNDTSQPFLVMAGGISNDRDDDGTIEPMFVPDSTSAPSRITVQITARSPVPDPMSGEAILYTVASDVTLRKSL